MKKKIYIGIDPDVDRSGVAWLDVATGDIKLLTLTFPELLDYLLEQRDIAQKTDSVLTVIIEAGWLNKSNWHVQRGDRVAAAAAVGNSTGRNHEVGRKIVEMVEHYGMKCEVRIPRSHKLKAGAFAIVTGIKTRTNQEQRDACMLVLPFKRSNYKI